MCAPTIGYGSDQIETNPNGWLVKLTRKFERPTKMHHRFLVNFLAGRIKNDD
jgi:hypothetical protein